MKKEINKETKTKRTGRKHSRRRSSRNNEEAKVKSSNATQPNVITESKVDNDPSWYTHIYPAVGDVANVPFNIMTGMSYNPIARPNLQNLTISYNNSYSRFDPGMLIYYFTPVLGDTKAANIAATQIYALMRQANSGAKNYEKSDLMMYILAMDSAYMLYEHLLRGYRVMCTVDYLNRYFPQDILNALGFGTGLMYSLADYRAMLNLFAYRLASLNVPDQFDFIHRHSWLSSNIYCDEESGRSQLYAYRVQSIYRWNEVVDGPATLDTMVIGRLDSLSQIRTVIDAVMDPLVGSEDIGTMNGDLIKAFGEGGMIKLSTVNEFESIKISHNEEVLEQMANILPIPYSHLDTLRISQDLSDLVNGPQIVQSITISSSGSEVVKDYTAMSGMRYLLNMHQAPSPENIMTATRLIPVIEERSDQQTLDITCGTELITGVYMVTRTFTNNTPALSTLNITDLFVSVIRQSEGKISDKAIADYISYVDALEKFKYHPTIYTFKFVDASNYEYVGHFQDDTCIQWLDDAVLERLHEVAVMSEYAVKSYPVGL